MDKVVKVPRYREIFIIHTKAGPWDCYFCGEDVLYEQLIVHHLDEDRSNNDLMNLVASHDVCHKSHHAAGKVFGPHTPERRAQIGEQHRGQVFTQEARAKISASQIGHPGHWKDKTLSPETRARMSVSQFKRQERKKNAS